MSVWFNFMGRGARTLNLAVGLIVASGQLLAAPYTGSGPGTSTIRADGSGDYVSLAAAIAAINGTPLTGGNWTFLIGSSTTETVKIALGQNTNGRQIIFRPAPGTQPVITFDSAESISSGWGGNWIIGTASKNSSTTPRKTDNITIDGSNNGTTSRDLRIRNTGNANSGQLITVAGDCDNFVVKNCILEMNSVFVTKAIRFAATNLPSSSQTPDNGLVENCLITATGPNGVGGISVDRNSASSATLGADSLTIRNNSIFGYLGITSSEHRQLTIERNRIDIFSNQPTGVIAAIQLFNSTTTSSGSSFPVRIERNEIQRVTRTVASNSAHIGIQVNRIPGPGAPAQLLTVANNSIGDLTLLAGATLQSNAQGIVVECPEKTSLIVHNSINMTLPATTTVTAVSAGIRFECPTSTRITMLGNLVSYRGPAGAGIQALTTSGSVESNNNNIFVADGAAFGSVVGALQPTRADWTAATGGLDANTTVQNPTVPGSPSAGIWVSASDLRFTAPVATILAGVPVPGVNVDLDGNLRSPSQPTKGAFESTYASAGVRDWALFH